MESVDILPPEKNAFIAYNIGVYESEQTKVLRIYFNNHYGGKAVINALEFKEMIGIKLSEKEVNMLEGAKSYLGRLNV